ncbi:MAG TPA: hypothetical protein VK420_09805, partial [Longimicrobium sp.]|nr:hypothetical protein [Longimicrobium sp.]
MRPVRRGTAGFACAAALAVTFAVPAHAQQQQPRPTFTVRGLEVTLGGRVQAQLSTSTVDSVPATDWLIRRARLELSTRYGPVFAGKFQVDFAGDVAIKDAFVRLNLHPALSVLAGNAHRPFGAIAQTSSLRMAPVERGVRVRGLRARDEYAVVTGLGYAERNLGVQLSGRPRLPLGVFYAAAVTRGPAHEIDGGEGSYQLSARAGFQPIKGVTLAGSWGRREFVQPPADSTPARSRGGHAWAIDAEAGGARPGPRAIAEVAFGDADPFTGRRFLGAQGWVSYRTGPLGRRIASVEPLLRISHGDPDAGRDTPDEGAGTLLTPGINVYLGGLHRVMFNYDVWRGAHGSPRAQS